MLTQVRSYQTSDGQLFTDKVQALKREGEISVQAVVNKAAIGKMPQIKPQDVTAFIVNNADSIIETLRKYKETIRRAQAGQKAANTRAAQ